MRTALLLSLIALAGCSKRTSAPISAGDPPPSLPVAPEPHEPSFIPRDEHNLRGLELTRQWRPGLEKDLAMGRFRYGGSLEEVVTAHRPDALLSHELYTTAVYAEVRGHLLGSDGHTIVVARNGKLVRASGSSCVWRVVFFNGMTKAEQVEWHESFDKVFLAHTATLGSNYRQTARIAVAGAAAVLPPTPIDRPIPAPREVHSAPRR